jgi:hypothetical protein
MMQLLQLRLRQINLNISAEELGAFIFVLIFWGFGVIHIGLVSATSNRFLTNIILKKQCIFKGSLNLPTKFEHRSLKT